MKGKVYLVGAGPGKYDLITVRGANILAQADVVIYDYLVDKQLLEYAPTYAEFICGGKLAHKGRYSYGHPVDQNIIDNIVIEKVNEGKKVVRLKNGDPAFFSRFSEELRALIKAGIEFEIIPGVTASGAASSLCGIPLTDRDHASSCVFVAGHENPSKKNTINNWEELSKAGTMVIYMGVGNLNRIVAKIRERGKPLETPVAIIKDVSLISQKIITGTLGNIVRLAKNKRLSSPAIIIIGSVCSMKEELNWSKRNKRVLFAGLSEERYFLAGNYVHVPLIKIVPAESYKEFDSYITHIRNYDWIVFSSRYGVEYFFQRFRNLGFDARRLHNAKIAVIGQSTRNKLNMYGINADLIPQDESSRGLIEAFKREDLKGKKIFIPRSNLSDKGIKTLLEEQGAEVIASVAYNNIMPDNLPDLDLSSFDEIMFTSPSTVRNFKKRYGKIPVDITVKCIGNVTKMEFEKEFK